VVWYAGGAPAPPPGFRRTDARRYGDTWVTFLEADLTGDLGAD
jgi:hypothetical protein